MFEKLIQHLPTGLTRSEVESKDRLEQSTAATAELMQQIKQSRAMLTIRIAGSEELYLSAVLEVNPELAYIVLDELNDQQGHQLLCKTGRLEIQTRLDDREIKFYCHLEAVGSDKGISYYKIPFPENLDYQLRRKHLRILPPKGAHLPVHLHTESHEIISGELNDLSSNGFSMILNRQGSEKLHFGDHIPKCLMQLGDEIPLEMSLEVRYCEDKRYHSQPRLGARFIDMDRYAQRRLQRYISQTDRLRLKGHQV